MKTEQLENEFAEARAARTMWESAALTHNYWLRILLLVAVLAIAAEAGALAYVVHENGHRKVPVVRVDSVGRAELFEAGDYDYKPRENEVSYFLGTFVREYYSRRRATLKEDQIASLKFLDKELAQQAMTRENRDKWMEAFLSSGDPEVLVKIRSVALPPHWASRKPPYSVVVEFDETKMTAGSEVGRDTVYATITFSADPSLILQDESLKLTNPLGFVIQDIQEGKTLTPVQ